MALVTVVVPTFRRPDRLGDALASIAAQTFTDLEVLVCDNGAQEETRRVVELLDDPRFRYVARPYDVGLMRNAVLGFRDATGALVMKVDDDDTLAPGTVDALVVAFARDPSTVVAFGRLELVDHAGMPMPRETRALEVVTSRDELRAGIVADIDRAAARGALSLACALFRKDAIAWDAVPTHVGTAYDLYLALCLAGAGGSAWFVPQARAFYRVHDGAETARRPARQGLGALAAFDVALASGGHRHPEQLRAARDDTAVCTARALVREREPRRARAILLDVLGRRASIPAGRLYALTFAPAAVASRVSLRRAARASARDVGAGQRPPPL